MEEKHRAIGMGCWVEGHGKVKQEQEQQEEERGDGLFSLFFFHSW